MLGAVLLDAFCVKFVSHALVWLFRSGKDKKAKRMFMFAIMCVSMAGICHGQCERVISVMDSKFIVCLSLSDLHKQGAKAFVRNKVS